MTAACHAQEGTLGRHETWVTSLATTPDAPDIMPLGDPERTGALFKGM